MKEAKRKGDKREGIVGEWDKIKYDRQIVAIARVENASKIYSADEDIHRHARTWGILPVNISDIPIPPAQQIAELE